MPTTLHQVSPESGLNRYLSEIRRFPILAPQEEYMLAKRWREHEDTTAAQKLVTSHLRLVAKIAMGYRGYGLPEGELVSEGNVGLMQAVKRFEPERGFRLATYAMWWIRASIQEYVLRSWSLVRMGATAAQKKLFFNLRKAKSRLSAYEEGDLKPENAEAIATRLGVRQKDVIDMNRRLGGDASLNAPLREGEDGSGEWQDRLVDDSLDQECVLARREESDNRYISLRSALKVLDSRERRILEARRLTDHRVPLGILALEFAVSGERVRQIEARAFEKLRRAVCAGVTRLEAPRGEPSYSFAYRGFESTYGTIVVDLERREVIDVLPDRSTAGTTNIFSASDRNAARPTSRTKIATDRRSPKRESAPRSARRPAPTLSAARACLAAPLPAHVSRTCRTRAAKPHAPRAAHLR